MENNENDKRLDLIFFALSDVRRRAIVEELSEDKKLVSELAKTSSLSMSAISKHLSLLEQAEIIYKTKQGRHVYCHLNFDIWKEVIKYINMQAKFWNNRLNELETFINKEM